MPFVFHFSLYSDFNFEELEKEAISQAFHAFLIRGELLANKSAQNPEVTLLPIQVCDAMLQVKNRVLFLCDIYILFW